MSYYSTKLLIASFSLCLLVSCNEGEHSAEKVENSTPIATKSVDQAAVKEITGPFRIPSGIIEYQDKNLQGEITAVFKLYFDNYGSLVKLEETVADETSTYLYNEETKKGATLFAGRSKANKIHMKQGEISRFVALRSQSGFVKKDNEQLLGRECEVYANNAKNDQGESKLVYWQHQGITLKEINRLGSGYLFEAIQLEEKTIEKSVFSLPNGVELPHNIFE